jgi:hypothetical protein
MNKEKAVQPDKGGMAEEALRSYFRSLGSFVLRGVPIREGRDDITDVDLWTYTRASVHARHISIVDIKNKKRAKGYERVIWFRGLQSALKADEAIIATTAGRENLKPFADRMGVRLLSHQVFQAVVARFSGDADRISSEELDQMWKSARIDSATPLNVRMRNNLEEVGLGISFTALNTWIDEAAFLLTRALDHERSPGPVTRAVLLCSALVAIGGDYLGRELSFSDQDSRRSHFRNGLIFGRSEPNAAKSYLGFAEKLVTDFVDRTGAAASTIRTGFNRAAEHLPVNQFIEFFARPTAGRELMDAALQLENAAFARTLPIIAQLPPEAKTVCLLIADYAGIERKRLLGAGQSGSAPLTPQKAEKTETEGNKSTGAGNERLL